MICPTCLESKCICLGQMRRADKPAPISAQQKMNDLFDGGWIERYHVKGQRMLTRQSVAEHSWRMAAIIFAVCTGPRKHSSETGFVPAGLLLAVLFHDVSERVTGDVPAHVKRANPEIERTVHEVSAAEEKRLGILFNISADDERLLSWADRYEGAMHCLDELEMGNSKIEPTLLRYASYCADKKYKLTNESNESNRLLLMEYLRQRLLKEIDYECQ